MRVRNDPNFKPKKIMRTSVLFVNDQGEQIAATDMSSVPRVNDEVEIGPNIGNKKRMLVRSVVWRVADDMPLSNSVVVVLF
jgi:hypothetical protein